MCFDTKTLLGTGWNPSEFSQKGGIARINTGRFSRDTSSLTILKMCHEAHSQILSVTGPVKFFGPSQTYRMYGPPSNDAAAPRLPRQRSLDGQKALLQNSIVSTALPIHSPLSLSLCVHTYIYIFSSHSISEPCRPRNVRNHPPWSTGSTIPSPRRATIVKFDCGVPNHNKK